MKNMATFNIKRSFSNNTYLKVPSHNSFSTPYNASVPDLPTFVTIDGSLSADKHLIHPLVIQIQADDGEFIVSESHYYICASGSTVQEAIVDFKRVMADEFDELTRDEKQLGPRLKKQLQYLRSIIR